MRKKDRHEGRVFIETELFVSGCLEMCLQEKSNNRDLCRTNNCELLIILFLIGTNIIYLTHSYNTIVFTKIVFKYVNMNKYEKCKYKISKSSLA